MVFGCKEAHVLFPPTPICVREYTLYDTELRMGVPEGQRVVLAMQNGGGRKDDPAKSGSDQSDNDSESIVAALQRTKPTVMILCASQVTHRVTAGGISPAVKTQLVCAVLAFYKLETAPPANAAQRQSLQTAVHNGQQLLLHNPSEGIVTSMRLWAGGAGDQLQLILLSIEPMAKK